MGMQLSKWVGSVAVLVVLLGAPRAQAEGKAVPPATQLSLEVGGTVSVDVTDVTRVAVGDASVADVKVSDAEGIEVTGTAAGTTKLIVIKKDGSRTAYSVVVH